MEAFPKATLYAQKALCLEFDHLHDLDLLNKKDGVDAGLADSESCSDCGLEVDEDTGEVDKEYVITDLMLGEEGEGDGCTMVYRAKYRGYTLLGQCRFLFDSSRSVLHGRCLLGSYACFR